MASNESDEKTEHILSEPFTNNGDCVLKDCKSIKRLKYILSYYQFINDNNQKEETQKLLIEYIATNKYDNMINDYHHILQTHLQTKEGPSNYQFINESMSRSIKCTFDNCAFYARNNAYRESDTSTDSTQKEEDPMGLFYMNLLDNIHSYFIHGYDAGFRMRVSNKDDEKEAPKAETDEEFDENKDYLADPEMNRVQVFQKTQRERWRESRGNERLNQNKFVTNTEALTTDSTDEESAKDAEEQKDKKEPDTKGPILYSFGQRYYYWPYYQNNDEPDEHNPGYKYSDWYIEPKYENMKTEVLKQLTIENYNEASSKAQQLLKQSQVLKAKKSKKFMYRNDFLHYDVPQGAPISEQNIMSLLFYTDFSKLCFEFSCTFRKISKDETDEQMRARNSNYWHFSKTLRETVELYGTPLSTQRTGLYGRNDFAPAIPVLYHGISCPMYFNSFVTRFCSPTSMTRQLTVASMFCGNNGIILEIEKTGSNMPYYFDCTLVSRFGNEDERLFFGGSKGLPWAHGLVQFRNIRSVETTRQFSHFVRSLTMFHKIMTGDHLDSKYYKGKFNFHFKIMKLIIKGKVDDAYIQGLYQKFVNNTKVIQLKIGLCKDGSYGTQCAKYFLNMDVVIPYVDKIARLFPNCETIKCSYDYTQKDKITKEWIMSLAEMLKNVNDKSDAGNALKLIRLIGLDGNANNNIQDVIEENKKVLNDNKWNMLELVSMAGEVDGIHNANYIDITLQT